MKNIKDNKDKLDQYYTTFSNIFKNFPKNSNYYNIVLEINNEQFIPDFVEQNKVKINIESLENGNYFVSVISDNSIYETKMITVVN